MLLSTCSHNNTNLSRAGLRTPGVHNRIPYMESNEQERIPADGRRIATTNGFEYENCTGTPEGDNRRNVPFCFLGLAASMTGCHVATPSYQPGSLATGII